MAEEKNVEETTPEVSVVPERHEHSAYDVDEPDYDAEPDYDVEETNAKSPGGTV